MKWNDPEYLEAIRLIRRFYPESKAVISNESGLHRDDFLGVMKSTNCGEDSSCDPTCGSTTSEMALASKGGLDGTEVEILERLLGLSGYSPSGRVVVVPDILGRGESKVECLPFVCAAETLPERIREFDQSRGAQRVFAEGGSDTLLVFESGEALFLDHDDRFYWSKSKS